MERGVRMVVLTLLVVASATPALSMEKELSIDIFEYKPELVFRPSEERPALNLTPEEKETKDLNKLDLSLLVVGNALLLIDWAQTLKASRNPERWCETNALLGEHPSASKVNLYMGGSLILFNLGSLVLPEPYRNLWQGVWIGVEGHAVVVNYNVGIRF